MIEIKSRWDGSILYTAENAQDVRQAVTEAVKSGANLGGANLGGANPFNGGIKYEVGETYEVKDANTNPDERCGAGINLATLPWCIQNWSPGHRILLAEFSSKDIAAIPIGDGKFRVHKAKIVRELDLTEIGLIDAKPADAKAIA